MWSIPQSSDQTTVERTPIRRRSGGTRIATPSSPVSDSQVGIEPLRRVDRRVTPQAPRIVEAERSELANRCVNLALASASLVVLSPVIVLVAIAVKLTSRGPVVYSQTRVGLDRRRHVIDALYSNRKQDQGGMIFTIYKFRTMRADAERNSGAVWATRNDPRVTKLGRILRRTRLDELPQLWNVIKGEMSLVGPRPMMPSQRTLYPGRAYYSLRPGVTGPWQVSDRNESEFAKRADFDLEYTRNLSFAYDLRLLGRTVDVVLRCTGY